MILLLFQLLLRAAVISGWEAKLPRGVSRAYLLTRSRSVIIPNGLLFLVITILPIFLGHQIRCMGRYF
jgi:hypothetical protein